MRMGFVLILAASLAGCATRRPYHAPEVTPAQLVNADPAQVSAEPLNLAWWEQFDDPVLDGLISRALDANRDIHAAVARLDQARAVFDERALDRFPHAPVNAVFNRS